MKVWQLRKGAERKIRSGHPWVFSNELAHSPKGTDPGEIIELRDFNGQFLARGYGHPNSLISFRKLSTSEQELDVLSPEFILKRLNEAHQTRKLMGLADYSYRLCFAEADGLPGLIVDRFPTPQGQALVLQTSTAGMDRALPAILKALEDWSELQGLLASTVIVVSNNSKSRLLENLTVEPRKVVRGELPTPTQILIKSFDNEVLTFDVDLLEGQKTGFFLDQHYNVTTTSRYVRECLKEWSELKVLDLCCYVGQWATHLAHTARMAERKAQVTVADASASALQLASTNAARENAEVISQKVDVLTDMGRLPDQFYEVVVCDPPAFIKRKKDIAQGRMAYVKMNRDALRKVKPGGLFISCSCSGALTTEDFREMLQTAVTKSGRRVRWVVQGSQSPDHPIRMEFPEGQYLKSFVGIVE